MPFRLIFFALLQALFLTAISAGSVVASEIFISLKPEAKISQFEITLNDVANVVALDLAEKRRIGSLRIAKLPSVSSVKPLSRSDIECGLINVSKEKLPTIVWGGAEKVYVSRKHQYVSLAPGIDAAAAFLFDQIGDGAKLSLRVMRGMSSVEVPTGKVVVWPDYSSIESSGDFIDVPLIVEVDGSLVMETNARFQLVPHGRAHGFAKTKLKAEVQVPSQLLPNVSVNTISANRSNSLVDKDQAVTLLIEEGGVRIETTGMALNDANKGEKVRVRRISGGAEIVGRVMQRGVVMVDEI